MAVSRVILLADHTGLVRLSKGALQVTVAGERIADPSGPFSGNHSAENHSAGITMSKSRNWTTGASRRRFLEQAAGVAAGSVLISRPLWAQGAGIGDRA